MNQTSDFDYKKYLHLISKNKYLFVILALLIMTGVVITSYLLPERYESKSTVYVEKSALSELVKGIALSPSSEDKIKVLTFAMKSRTMLLKVINDLGLNVKTEKSGHLENLVKAFQDNTDIKLNEKEGLITITFSNGNPLLARDYVNALVHRYIEENISSKREESYGANNLLAGQITSTKAKLEETENRADNYKRVNGSLLAQNESALMAEIGEAQQKLNEVEVKSRQLESQLSLAKKNNPLKIKLDALQKKQQELGIVYTDNHPDVVETKNEIASIKEQIQSGLSRSEQGAVPSLEVEKITMELNSQRDIANSYKRFIASRQSQLRSIPAARSGLDELEREKNSQKNLYEQLVIRYGQSEVSKQIDVQGKATTFRIVDPAILPIRPISPQRVNIILFGIIGGVAASFGLLVLLDTLDKSVRNVESLKSLGVPVLAVVPTIENQVELLALRRRDYWFYGIAALCFMLILATIPLELMRYHPTTLSALPASKRI